MVVKYVNITNKNRLKISPLGSLIAVGVVRLLVLLQPGCSFMASSVSNKSGDTSWSELSACSGISSSLMVSISLVLGWESIGSKSSPFLSFFAPFFTKKRSILLLERSVRRETQNRFTSPQSLNSPYLAHYSSHTLKVWYRHNRCSEWIVARAWHATRVWNAICVKIEWVLREVCSGDWWLF